MEKCLQLLNNRRQSISLRDEAPKTISSPRQHEAYISRLLELRRKAHRAAEETETAKLLIVLIADYEGKHLTTEKASAAQVLKELMNANGLRRKELAEDLGGESIVSLILRGKRQLNRQQMERLTSVFASHRQFSSSALSMKDPGTRPTFPTTS